MSDAEGLQKVIDENIELTEQLINDYRLNWCLMDAVRLIEQNSKEWFIEKLEEMLERENKKQT